MTQPMRYSYGQIIMQVCPSGTFGVLQRKGLVDGACLTPLGLAVRQHLKGSPDHD
jgi:hypothetical protein